jgi:hypothetical protein
MAERPYLISGLGILWGYFQARREKAPQIEDQRYLNYLRRFERESLLLGKRRATERCHNEIRRRAPPTADAAK